MLRLALAATALFAALLWATKVEAAGTVTLSITGSSSTTFSVSQVTNAALAPTPAKVSFTMVATTSTLGGHVYVSIPTVTAPDGGKLAYTAYKATCKSTSDPAGMFTSNGAVAVDGVTACGTLAANHSGTVKFTVSLTLDCLPDADSFPVDTYSGTTSVTADTP